MKTFLLSSFCCFVLMGCGTSNGSSERDGENHSNDNQLETPKAEQPQELTISELREKLGANANAKFGKVAGEIRVADLFGSGVKDISALKGLPLERLSLNGLKIDDLSVLNGMELEVLDLGETDVTDLSPLSGMPLKELYLANSKVTDISPLKDLKLRQLNLQGLKVTDISAVSEMPLQILWLIDTAVTDLSPLRGTHIISLDIEGTKISDLKPVGNLRALQRLNLARTPVEDVTPLAGLQLQRLIFNPGKIRKGIAVLRNMGSLQAMGLGTSIETVKRPAEFWQEYDAGKYIQIPFAAPSN